MGHGIEMSFRPTIQTVGKAEIRFQPMRVLAAVGACLVFQPYFNSCHGSFRLRHRLNYQVLWNGLFASLDFSSLDISSLDVSGLVVVRPHDTGTSHKLLALARDFLVCLETEDPDPCDENPGHPQALSGANLLPLGEFSTSHDSARAGFLPSLAIQGLMSRRF